jgi:NaMN:DMB phosphoribosyltransferase
MASRTDPTLNTYQAGRRRIIQNFIDLDHCFSRLFSGRPTKDVMEEEGISMPEFEDAFEKGNILGCLAAGSVCQFCDKGG